MPTFDLNFTCNVGKGSVTLSFLTISYREADLSDQFYGLYAKEHVLRMEVKRGWKELFDLPEDQQLLEKGVVLKPSMLSSGLETTVYEEKVITCTHILSQCIHRSTSGSLL